ncbi:hypothetical protein APHNP_1175 [Anaplasma phagocytophilum str. ApNP]|uniref:Uncharacterized protein n=1 Tax=Anaplasma phagocytophilum str. ApNP TaxID=1359153 RepID=A0A0F3NFA9_ANAPH|nr:hypothetical protein APHNP_1175 [Anaplasma phagocytophilum str. ApNP]
MISRMWQFSMLHTSDIAKQWRALVEATCACGSGSNFSTTY